MSPTEEETRRHIHRVQHLMYKLTRILQDRCERHDRSKLEEPEKSGFEAMDAEPFYPYGSPEYFDKLNRYRPILEHHYKHNPHHPEHYAGFIGEMDLIDMLEMLCDWASRRDGLSVDETITLVEQQSERFQMPSILSSILLNTLKRHLATEFYDSPKTARPNSVQIENIATGTLRPAENSPSAEPTAAPQKQFSKPPASVPTPAVSSAAAKPAESVGTPKQSDDDTFGGLFSRSSIDLSALKEFGI